MIRHFYTFIYLFNAAPTLSSAVCWIAWAENSVRPSVRASALPAPSYLPQKKSGRATFPEISKRWVEMSKSPSRDLRCRPNVTEPSQAESQSQARPGQAEPIAPTSFTQFPQAPPICISGLRPGLCGSGSQIISPQNPEYHVVSVFFFDFSCCFPDFVIARRRRRHGLAAVFFFLTFQTFRALSFLNVSEVF